MRLDTVEYVFPVEFMCERLDVSKSGYYDWRRRPDSAAARRREELKLLVQKAFGESDSTYGYRRVHAQVARWGHAAGLELVRQLMRELGLQPCQPRPKRFNLTQAVAGTVPDLVGRDFTADTPGEKRSNRVCDGRPLPDTADIPGHPQCRPEQEARTRCDISLGPRK
ncbi:IS3 family transposase [Streptomyces sp. NBC_01619]|uniref:IS3 family transposase n=1 Tax=Streptomyces sp. NBC_01619 TaxID=2975901 RepID=UPI0022567522|nr:IS3 family transposase [Streptomyces sp. NBC_01619]MCX4516011.1 IS3 family transposase [Streptomyces sp. NBC_01619]